jgi:LuxR family maltose regulon positive regulatory protein
LLHRLGDPWEQGRRLTLISAPAGYGKTTLLADWLRSLPMQTAWLMLEPADNDRARFLAYLIAALQRVYPSAGQAARAMLAAPQPPPGEAILTALLNDLAAQPGRCCLALDDYHVIHTRLIHQQVAFLLEHLPGNLHLAIATREDPLLPVSRLRARGQLTEIRQEDLRFSNEETAGFLQQTMALALDGEDIAALEQRTEGWIAGLQLAAASMQGRSDLKGFVQAFSGSSRFILDYLIEEVFEGQPPEVQEFLLKTSILDCLSAPLCDAVTQISSSQAILEALERANLFILPLDQRRQWYRYHHLFGELLQHRLRLGGFSVKEAHGAASQWFEQNHFPAQAVQHALSGEDWPRAARLIRGVSSDLLKRGEAATLVGWFAALPQEMIWADPRLGFETCWPLLLAGEFEQAAPRLAHVEQMAQGMPEFLGEVLAAQAFLARVRGEHERMQELSQRALALLPKSSLGSRGVLAVNLGLAYWHMGRMADAELILAEALEAGRAIANHYVVFTAMIFQGRILAVRGRLRHAAEAFRLAIAQGGEIPINALAHLDLSALCYEWNDLINSETHLQKAFTLSRRAGNDEFVAACWMMHVCLRAAQGDYRAAQAGLDEAWGMVRSGAISAAMASRVDVSQARLLLAQGKPAEAEGWVEKLTERVDSHPFYRFLGVTRARLLPAAHARAYLAGLSAAAEANGWEYGLIAVRLYQALAAESPVAALEFLEDALRLAQPEGCLRIFAESGPALAPLLIEAARRGVAADYIGRILELIPAGSAPASPGQQVLVEPLSERELQVLRLLAVGLSNREIADKLVISTGTAKTHIHNVSGKLGVRNRTEAAMRAKELHLI